MAELQGRVLKNYNGYYYLKVEGESELYTCKVKGKMKKNRLKADLILRHNLEIRKNNVLQVCQVVKKR